MSLPARVYLNGEFMLPSSARISVFDRGFVFGDGVYEVIPVYGGRPFRLAHHLQRLDASLAAIRISNPMTPREWENIFLELAGECGPIDQSIYLEVTRGVAPRDHAFPAGVTPTVFAYAQPLTYPAIDQVQEGVRAITVPDIRWSRCDIKAIALLANVLMRQNAVEHGCTEAILVRDDRVTEGSASNIFIVSGGVLSTPSKGPFILPGITRDLVIELSHANEIPCVEKEIHKSELFSADEVWMTSSTKEILSIVRIDDRRIGTGRPGPMHARLQALYQDYKHAFRRGGAE
ncbi:MAG: D-amino acid aminotransferase [Acidiferrobacterales bacterium]